MSSAFEIKEHVIDAQHIREYPRATADSQEEVFKLAVKQYTPKNNPNPQPGDLTLIATHANGFVKVRILYAADPTEDAGCHDVFSADTLRRRSTSLCGRTWSMP